MRQQTSKRAPLPLLLRAALLVAASPLVLAACQNKATRDAALLATTPASARYVSFQASVQPILNARCAVCHSCYDAPCQLDHTSFTGTDRGASSSNPYSDRLISVDPTRLYIDAGSTAAWRQLGFFPVINHHPSGDDRNLTESILYRLITQRREQPLPTMRFDAYRSRRCPNLASMLPQLHEEIASVFGANPYSDLGMPYGFPPLSDQEFGIVRKWLELGAPGPSEEPLVSRAEQRAIEQWELFLNGSSAKERLVARYLYEHLSFAHLYFSDLSTQNGGERNFYRLVRSRSAPPQAIDEIATRRPYDDPGEDPFFYRLRRVESTIVHKTHLPVALNNSQQKRLMQLFLGNDWSLASERLPKYGSGESGNPFQIFAAIPARARYQFMLEHAEFFVAAFMKGPVCRGSLALNVINDNFWIFFLDPDADPSIQDPTLLSRAGKHLVTPFRPEDSLNSDASSDLWSVIEYPIEAVRQLRYSYYPYYKKQQLQYLKRQDASFERLRPSGFSLTDIWDGNGSNTNALLTVFRHWDSASVRRGAWGATPKTSLVIDYPIFERMFYNLVVSFDIFSSIKDQLATRLYMDDLRIEAEDLFLSFLPLSKRKAIRDHWYRDAETTINSDDYPFYGTNHGVPRDTQVPFTGAESAQQELYSLLIHHRIPPAARGAADPLNTSTERSSEFAPIESKTELDAALRKVAGKTGTYIPLLPDLAFVRFRGVSSNGRADLVYSFIRNRAHLNVKYLFSESTRLVEAEDTLSVIEGFEGSYPNFFFDVPLYRAHDFLQDLVTLTPGSESFQNFIRAYGVRRLDERFWPLSDWFTKRFKEEKPISAGLFDLNRYENY